MWRCETERVRMMLTKFEDLWQGQLGEVKNRAHKIDLIPVARPQAVQLYRAGDHKRKAIQENIDDLLEKKVIEPAHSEWAAPVVLVPKADGSLRSYVDYRRLSSLIIRDTYPIPRMDDCLNSLAEAKYFPTMDCSSGY